MLRVFHIFGAPCRRNFARNIRYPFVETKPATPISFHMVVRIVCLEMVTMCPNEKLKNEGKKRNGEVGGELDGNDSGSYTW